MCRYCIEYGNGTKWYLNPDNYRGELYENENFHTKPLKRLSGAGKNSFEVGGMAKHDDLTGDVESMDAGNMTTEFMMRHQGHIVPIEDVLKILDLVNGDRFALMHCACRRYFGDEDFYSCLFFPQSIDIMLKERPWETDTKIIDREEAKLLMREMSKLGMVHNLFDLGTDVDGKPPIVLCNCHHADCMTTRIRGMFYGQEGGVTKGEYVIKIDAEKCRDCEEAPCLKRCSFGALYYHPLKKQVLANIHACAGCGACRIVCPSQAMKLVDRVETYPGLVDNW